MFDKNYKKTSLSIKNSFVNNAFNSLSDTSSSYKMYLTFSA